MRVAVIDYDLGNLPSVTKALERVGATQEIVAKGGDLDESFGALVLPGVGHFGAGARNLHDRGFLEPLREWAAAGRPFLGICVGLQLLMETSEEDADARGLGIVPGTCRRLHAPKVPHMGWNLVEPATGDRLTARLAGEPVYFVHSYYVDPQEEAAVAGRTDYEGTSFCSVVRHGSVTGVQFHPEKSARVGLGLLEAWVKESSA